MNYKKYAQVISLLILFAAVYFSFFSLMPSSKIEEPEIATEFSINNALKHVKEISKKPHFTGSNELEVVRNYIVSQLETMGLQVEVQEHMAVNGKWKAATKTKNILAKIKGSENGKALLLLSHYDSNPHSSLGASDAGSGVATILEGVRTYLANYNLPKNDIIICITDAEELGLLGAKTFVDHHPWAKEVGLVLNFEARGSGGPSYMFIETNEGNKNLIEAFQNAKTPYPVANSLMYSIYKMLPNDTDLTVFREDGNINGFNFAFIGDHFDYHTVQDSYNRIDINTLKHQASYFMPTVNYFANSNLEILNAQEDFVYFNFPYIGIVFYPFSWVIPLFLVVTVLFLVLIFIGFSKRKLTIKGISKGFIPFILSLVFSGTITFFGWKFLLKIHPQYNDILHGFTYNGYTYIVVFVAFTLAITLWFYKGFFKKRTNQDLIIAPMLFWLVFNGFIAFKLQGASFFMLPVIVLLLILAILIFSKESNYSIFFSLLAIPVIVIFTPLIKMLPVGLGLKMLFVSSIFTVLVFGVVLPVLYYFSNSKSLIRLFNLVGLIALIAATFNSSFSIDKRQPNSILYMLDADKNEAYWATYNSKIDTFTKQFLGENPTEGSYDENTTASKYKTKLKWHTAAEVKDLKKPVVQVISDTIIGNNRKVCLSIYSERAANKVEILSKIPISFKSFTVNDESVKRKLKNPFVLTIEKGTVLSYYLTEKNELIDIEMVVDKAQEFDLDIMEAKYDLFTNSQFKIEPRTQVMMPMPFVLNDATVIKTNIKF